MRAYLRLFCDFARLNLPLSRALRDIFTGLHHLKVQNTKPKPAGLLPVTESPVGRSPEPSTGGGTAGGAVGMQAGRPSPLGRNVVTALEAELDQVLLVSRSSALMTKICLQLKVQIYELSPLHAKIVDAWQSSR